MDTTPASPPPDTLSRREFDSFLESTVNPVREREGLLPVEGAEADRAYEILRNFHGAWNTESKGVGAGR